MTTDSCLILIPKIIDGDTIEVTIQGMSFTVRYIGIDTPETSGESYAIEATQFNRSLVEGKPIILVKDVNETDKYNRLLRYVLVDGLFVNYELVRQGFAYAKDYSPDTSCSQVLHYGEAKAKIDGFYLWSSAFNSLHTTSTIQPISTPITRLEGVEVAPCNCNGPDLDCKDFPNRASAQKCWNYCRTQGIANPFKLDGSDGDGRVCETMP